MEKLGGHECEQYKISSNDLFEADAEIDRILDESYEMVKKCSRSREECPIEIETNELLDIMLVLLTLDKDLSTKFMFLGTRNIFINFLNREIDRLKDLLHVATRPRVEIPCSKVEAEDERINVIVNDTCSKFSGGMDLETAVHSFYRLSKSSLDMILQQSDKVKSFITLQERSPRFLSGINYALHRYYSALNCDWQAITAKYIQLRFQIHNLNFWIESVQEKLTIPSVSDFVSERMQNFILQASEESLQLALKLTSSKPTEEYTYLRLLRFRKPPFWDETFKGRGNFG